LTVKFFKFKNKHQVKTQKRGVDRVSLSASLVELTFDSWIWT